MSGSISATASMIRSRSFWRLAGTGGTKTMSFTNPHKKKSQGVKSGELSVQRINATSSCSKRPFPTLWQICVEIVSYVIMKMSRTAILTVCYLSLLSFLRNYTINFYPSGKLWKQSDVFLTKLVVSGMIRCIVSLWLIFKMFHGIMKDGVFNMGGSPGDVSENLWCRRCKRRVGEWAVT